MRISKRIAKHAPKNICRDYNGPGDHYVYCDITGWRLFKSEVVHMPMYSGLGGMVAHKSYALPNAEGYMPFVPPIEEPIKETRFLYNTPPVVVQLTFPLTYK